MVHDVYEKVVVLCRSSMLLYGMIRCVGQCVIFYVSVVCCTVWVLYKEITWFWNTFIELNEMVTNPY